MSLCNGKYIVYCPAFDIVWSVSPWIGEGEFWVKMCPEKNEYHPGWTTFLWFMELLKLTFPIHPQYLYLMLDNYHLQFQRGLFYNLDYYENKLNKRKGITPGLKATMIRHAGRGLW